MNRMQFMPDLHMYVGSFSLAMLFAGTLLTLGCWLPSTAVFADTQEQAGSAVPANLLLDKAGVSIVRLIASYRANNPNGSNLRTFSCTGLGILVGSAAQFFDAQIVSTGTQSVCPNCHQTAQLGEAVCPNCRLALSPALLPMAEERDVSRMLSEGLVQEKVGGRDPDRVALERGLLNLWDQVGQ